MNTITGLLIDVHNGTVRVEKIPRDLQSYYKLLQCDLIDITPRKIKNKPYLFVCDDEGLLKAKPLISAVDSFGHPMFVGSLFIVNDKDDDDLQDLTEKDIEYITKHIRMLKTFCAEPEMLPILHNVDYI